MEPTDKLDVTLQAQEWEAVMRAMAKAPYEIVAPLIGEIQRQCVAQQQPAPPLALVPRDQPAE
jgi:hypothetical protein